LAQHSERRPERYEVPTDKAWREAPLGQWMTSHRVELDCLLKLHSAPPWDRLATVFAAAGLTDGRGRQPNALTTRVTWELVRAPSVERLKPVGRGPRRA